MPGVPKSCAVCQARKVKCDRRSPACSQCIKYQWHCPGYPAARPKKKISGPQKTPSREKRLRSPPNLLDASAWIQRSPAQELISLPSPTGRSSRWHEENRNGSSCSPRLSILSPALHLSPVVLQLVDCLSSTSPGLSLHEIGSFISLVPARLGVSDALDTAVRCLCAAYTKFASPRPSPHALHYNKALSSLRKSLCDPAEALSAETLCASICLSWYETMVDRRSSAWLAHSMASADLIQLRGPGVHMTGFDRALLLAHHGLISSHALMQRKPSFMCEPAWIAVVDPTGSGDGHDSMSHAQLIVEHFQHLDGLSLVRNRISDVISTGDYDQPNLNQLTETLKCLRLALRAHLPIPQQHFWWVRSGQPLHIETPHPVLLCKDALAYLSINIETLNLLDKLRWAAEYNLCMAETISNVIRIFNSGEREGHAEGIRGDVSLQTLQESLNAEIEALFSLASHAFQRAISASPLSCRRLALIYQALYCSLQTRGEGFHPIWHSMMEMFVNS
uniref:Zn(2)-C6 fungal-type domain-containing protein n=1 Tax=Bionectria ochroleuca TaxID=29856 RepID=A0A0B7KDJ5_BIOOC